MTPSQQNSSEPRSPKSQAPKQQPPKSRAAKQGRSGPPRISGDDPGELLALASYALGYVPHQEVVIQGLNARTSQLVATSRFTATGFREPDQDMLHRAIRQTVNQNAQHLIILFVECEPVEFDLPIGVGAQVWVLEYGYGVRILPLPVQEPIKLQTMDSTQVAAEYTYMGKSLARNAASVDQIDVDPAFEQRVTTALDALSPRTHWDHFVAVKALLGRSQLTAGTTARIIAALNYAPARDAALCGMWEGQRGATAVYGPDGFDGELIEEATQRILDGKKCPATRGAPGGFVWSRIVHCASYAPMECKPHIHALLAFAAWSYGDITRASNHCTFALNLDPHQGLATLVFNLVSNRLQPGWMELRADLKDAGSGYQRRLAS